MLNSLINQSKKPNGFVGRLMLKIMAKSYRKMYTWSISFLPASQNLMILDIGCGNGDSTKLLAQKFTESAITGIDYAETAIILAQQKNNHEQITFLNADVTKLPFNEDSIDIVTAFQTHFHWSDLAAGLNEIHRVLKPTGKLLIACEEVKLKYFLTAYSDDQQVKSLLIKFGFKIFQVHRRNGFVLYLVENG